MSCLCTSDTPRHRPVWPPGVPGQILHLFQWLNLQMGRNSTIAARCRDLLSRSSKSPLQPPIQLMKTPLGLGLSKGRNQPRKQTNVPSMKSCRRFLCQIKSRHWGWSSLTLRCYCGCFRMPVLRSAPHSSYTPWLLLQPRLVCWTLFGITFLRWTRLWKFCCPQISIQTDL